MRLVAPASVWHRNPRILKNTDENQEFSTWRDVQGNWPQTISLFSLFNIINNFSKRNFEKFAVREVTSQKIVRSANWLTGNLYAGELPCLVATIHTYIYIHTCIYLSQAALCPKKLKSPHNIMTGNCNRQTSQFMFILSLYYCKSSLIKRKNRCFPVQQWTTAWRWQFMTRIWHLGPYC